LQLGVAEERVVGGGGEGACDLVDEVGGAPAEGVGEFVGEGLLLGGEWGRGHGASSGTRGVDFWPRERFAPLCTKFPPTCETPTRRGARPGFPLAPPGLPDHDRGGPGAPASPSPRLAPPPEDAGMTRLSRTTLCLAALLVAASARAADAPVF